MPLTDEQIRALRDGCKNVSRPPWVISRPIIEDYSWMEIPFEIGTADRGLAWRVAKATDAAHIARCDPQTISELCTRVLTAEERMKAAEEQASKLRMCVNCGKYAPADHPRHEPLPECVDPATGLSSCTFDMTPHEAWLHWSRMAHALQARIKVLEDALRPFTEATLAIDKAWIRKARKALEEAPKAPL